MGKKSVSERQLLSDINGYFFLLIALGSAGYAALMFLRNNMTPTVETYVFGIIAFLIFTGLTIIAPNEAVVTTFLGSYMGSVKKNGLRFIIPFYGKQKISLRSRNLNGHMLKVNDKSGNPIEIAAVIVWQVEDTAKATFDVDDYELFVHIQSEAAVRNLATSYPYDHSNDNNAEITLRDSTGHINEKLVYELNDRLVDAGVTVTEARISHLAYAPEIAMAMLQRQQASAVVAARQQIVEGAVGMVELALQRLEEHDTVKLSTAERAQLVSNLLVVLCSENNVMPTVSMSQQTNNLNKHL